MNKIASMIAIEIAKAVVVGVSSRIIINEVTKQFDKKAKDQEQKFRGTYRSGTYYYY